MIWCHIANYAIIHFYIVHLSPEVLNTIFYNAQYIVLISACRHSKDITRLYFHKKFLTCILFVIVILWGGWSVHSVTGSIQRYILSSKLPPLVSKSFKSEKKKQQTNCYSYAMVSHFFICKFYMNEKAINTLYHNTTHL